MFHVKENLKHFAIGQLMYENYTKTFPSVNEHRSISMSVSKVINHTEVKSPKKDLFSSKSTRQSRQPYSRALKMNSTTAAVPKNTIRKHRDTDMDSGFYVSVMPNVYYDDPNARDWSERRSNRYVRSLKPKYKTIDSKRHVHLERSHAQQSTTTGDEAPVLDVYNEVRVSVVDESDPAPLTEPPIEVIITPRSVHRSAKQTNLFVVKPNETSQVTGRRSQSSVDLKQHLRFVIANQQDVTDKIAITDDGTLMTLEGLDREVRDVYRLTVLAEYSKGFASGAGIYQVTIYVDDVNDNPPTFNRNSYSGIISENSALGSDVYINHQMIVQDADAGENANFTVSLSGEGSHLFKVVLVNMTNTPSKNITKKTDNFLEKYENLEKFFPNLPFFLMDNQSHMDVPHYIIRFIGPNTLDRERTGFYALRLVAKDKGGLKSEVKLDIMIADVNDNAPSFERIAIAEQSGVLILDASNYLNTYYVKNLISDPAQDVAGEAENAEHDASTHYALASTSTVNKMNYKTAVGTPRHLGGTTRRSADFEEVDNRAMPRFSIPENVTLARPIMQISAVDDDLDKNADVLYEISAEKIVMPGGFKISGSAHVYFAIDQRSGELQVVRPLPAESHIYVNFTAKDVGGLRDHVTIKFEVFWRSVNCYSLCHN